MFFHGDVNLLARVTDKPTKATNIAPPPQRTIMISQYILIRYAHIKYITMTIEHD